MDTNTKKVCILGSTGSIGCNTLNVIRNLKNNGYPIEVISLTTNTNIDILAEQVKEFAPKTVLILNKDKAEEFKNKYSFDVEILSGEDNLVQLTARDDYNLLVSALVGFAGLQPTIEAIRTGKNIALANKETLIVAGELINSLLKQYNTTLTPIDSEHSAIFQCLAGEEPEFVSKIILTASGGPFRAKSIDEMRNTSVKEALNHPNWNMGPKITIDSATLMNKGLEVIEAYWLFGVTSKNIEVVVHPQSIIHSMVEFIDGSIKAQMGVPDMKIPIQYAITYPERVTSDFERMDFTKYGTLTFEQPDLVKFECLDLAYKVLSKGGTYPTVLNAANEVAVDLFINEKIGFMDIPAIIKNSLDSHESRNKFEFEDIIEVDRLTREGINRY
ncbi:MAG TPA: 1-deoxy-D-xylulose-5-phosphate reductoisomerase [Ignavibacteria bacterium]|nr:1-deoxy-D-xylulose-5-phosphate reductoisomerase [Ignavibacteria bacterium]